MAEFVFPFFDQSARQTIYGPLCEVAGTRLGGCLPCSLSVHPFLHEHLSGPSCNPVYPANPCHGIAGFEFLRHAFGLPHLLHQPLIPLLSLRLEVAQVGHQLVRKEHFHIGMGLMFLQEDQMKVCPSAQRAAVLRVREIREIVVTVQGVVDTVLQDVFAQFTHAFCPPCWWRRSAAE